MSSNSAGILHQVDKQFCHKGLIETSFCLFSLCETLTSEETVSVAASSPVLISAHAARAFRQVRPGMSGDCCVCVNVFSTGHSSLFQF